jgi:hypothetical protein
MIAYSGGYLSGGCRQLCVYWRGQDFAVDSIRYISAISCLPHDGVLNLNTDARHIFVISEAAIQYCFYDSADHDLEVVNSFILLVATKNRYQGVLGRLVGDEPATGLQAPAGGANLTAKIQSLAEGLASSLMQKEGASAFTESKSLSRTLLQWALKGENGTLIEILIVMKGAILTAEFLQLQYSLHEVVRTCHRQTVVLVVSRLRMNADTSVREGGLTALQEITREGSESVVLELLNAGADANAPAVGESGFTSLYAAASGGYHILLDMLLKAGRRGECSIGWWPYSPAGSYKWRISYRNGDAAQGWC